MSGIFALCSIEIEIDNCQAEEDPATTKGLNFLDNFGIFLLLTSFMDSKRIAVVFTPSSFEVAVVSRSVTKGAGAVMQPPRINQKYRNSKPENAEIFPGCAINNWKAGVYIAVGNSISGFLSRYMVSFNRCFCLLRTYEYVCMYVRTHMIL